MVCCIQRSPQCIVRHLPRSSLVDIFAPFILPQMPLVRPAISYCYNREYKTNWWRIDGWERLPRVAEEIGAACICRGHV